MMPDNRQIKVNADTIFVLGAGADKVLGLPLLTTLFRNLNDFIHGAGKDINKAIREHAKPLRFDLQSYSGDQAENLGQKLLGSHTHLLPIIRAALAKHPDSESANVAAIKEVMGKMAVIADGNSLDEPLMERLSKLAGEDEPGVDDTLLDTDHISFRPKVRQAIKTLLSQASAEIPGLTQVEIDAFAEVIAILSNFEELLGSLFIGYFTKHIPNQKKYFYMAWLFWAYIRHKEDLGRPDREKSFYKTLSDVGSGGGIITFNYTDFFDAGTRPKHGYFHGDSKSFIRFHTREYVSNDVQIREANTLGKILAFIKELRVDWTKDPPEVMLPAFVPPLAMKPVICAEYLERWYECGLSIKKAKTIVIVGYSFNVADEHFNDLIRKGNKDAKLIVIDPNLEGAMNRVCLTLAHDRAALKQMTVQGLECRADQRMTFVKAKAEEITGPKLMALLDTGEQKTPAKK
jgi:hypothetical protein